MLTFLLWYAHPLTYSILLPTIFKFCVKIWIFESKNWITHRHFLYSYEDFFFFIIIGLLTGFSSDCLALNQNFKILLRMSNLGFSKMYLYSVYFDVLHWTANFRDSFCSFLCRTLLKNWYWNHILYIFVFILHFVIVLLSSEKRMLGMEKQNNIFFMWHFTPNIYCANVITLEFKIRNTEKSITIIRVWT